MHHQQHQGTAGAGLGGWALPGRAHSLAGTQHLQAGRQAARQTMSQQADIMTGHGTMRLMTWC
jgi:hypothetical protein